MIAQEYHSDDASAASHVSRQVKVVKRLSSDIGLASHIANAGLTKWGICLLNWPDEPWTINWYASVRGQESLHVYFWIMKDLSWVQSWYYPGYFFGALSVAWMAYILIQAFRKRSIDEIWCTLAHLLWLLGNFVWMIGELHDSTFPDHESVYDARAEECYYIFVVAIIWIGLYYAILKPFNLVNETTSRSDEYDTTGLKCRFSFYFKTWREYENFHILLWVGKELAWY